MKHIFKLAMPAFLSCAAILATPSVQATQIVVGQVAPLSGPEASQGRAYAAGMQFLFNDINRAGGVNGHTFELVSKDDGGGPEDTVAITRQLLTENQPMVLAGYFGNRNISELVIAGFLEKEKLALVGYRAAEIGVEIPQLYNVRANFRTELSKITEHLAAIGVTRLGLLYEEGPGAAALIAVTEEIAKKGNATIVSKASYEAGTTRVADAIDTFVKAKPQAIILVCSGAAGARFIERYRADGGSAQIFIHSGADMERVTKRIAENRLAFVSSVMQGVAIAQVVPSPYHSSRLAKELNEAVAKDGKLDVPVSYVMMEGYIAAKVIIEAVRRQGKRPTREGMAAALESIDSLNLGGYVVGFKPGMRSGSKFVELTIISDTGKIRQ
ncbi:ABC transporter substrate-binding protein [Polaromonas sp. JS666]|uniref:ABC transporter substrate-binding protein n=1 Tax=Polaromonas sp. (strain JS666 / ATCC BAA-500) TaxID=296591 RepID=UPI0000535BE0|nr:ABC transporter substrate-binding protein [Polaromonas sp. JS666]ABE46296.1 amino acid/amide ABC transporter substrate-binding protein, HAAT family [Polaromonas sp. JS666]